MHTALLNNVQRCISALRVIVDDESIDDPIPNHELSWLTSIVEQAQNGDWESAAKSSKRMMEDQVEY